MKYLGLIFSLIFLTSCQNMAKKSYKGFGEGSVSAQDLKHYAPKALKPGVSTKIQRYLDVRSPGLGLPSPNGKKLFFTWGVTGTRQVWRLDSPKSFPIQMTAGEDSTSLLDITKDGRYLILSRDQKGQEHPQLYRQKTTGGSLEKIFGEKGVKIRYDFLGEQSRYIYFRANDKDPSTMTIYRIHIKNKKRELVFHRKGYWFVADRRNKDQQLILGKAKSNTAFEYYLYDVPSKKMTPLLGQNENESYFMSFAAQKNNYLVLTNKFTDFQRLYKWNPKTKGQKFKAITPVRNYDIDTFSIDRQRTRITYSINDKGYLKLKAISAKNFKPIKIPNFKNAIHTYAGRVSKNGRYQTFGVSRATSPRVSYILNWRTKKLTQWVIPSSPEIDTSTFSKSSLEYIPARDGTALPVFVRRPKKCQKPCPVIVDFHGGPESQRHPGFSPYFQLFLDAGFIVVEPNVRGSSGYGKKWLMSDNGPKRLNVITDIEDIALYIRKNWAHKGQAPRIGVSGGSYGGYSAMMAMTRFAGAYDAGVAVVGMSNLITFLEQTAPYRRALRVSEYGDPVKDREALKKLSPVTYINRIQGPLMIIQGVSDPRVPAGESVQMQKLMEKKNLSSELILFADEGHGISKRKNRVLYIGHILEFFKKHLKN